MCLFLAENPPPTSAANPAYCFKASIKIFIPWLGLTAKLIVVKLLILYFLGSSWLISILFLKIIILSLGIS